LFAAKRKNKIKKFETLWFRTTCLRIVTRDGGAKGVGLTCKDEIMNAF
jgi:hypothetical protein